MEKKYTVFISSTYSDLKEERQKVLDAVLQSDCIPVGMEYFPAADDEQFVIIKKLIDECDFYVLIIGGRYGSVNPNTKISYTEMEYDYAVAQEIPILVFERSNIVGLNDDKKDKDMTMLDKFKQKAGERRMAKMWKTHDELVAGVITALFHAKKTYNRPGWARGAQDNTERLTQINHLRIENDKFKKENETLKELKENHDELAFYGEKIKIHFIEYHYAVFSDTVTREFDKEYTLDEIFKIISLRLMTPITESGLRESFRALVSGYYVDFQTILEIRAQFYALGLIEIETDKKGIETTKLTEKGKIEMKKLNAIKKQKEEV